MQAAMEEAPGTEQGHQGKSLNNEQQQPEISITQASHQEPVIFTEEEAKAIWRSGMCEVLEAYHATIRDLLPETVRDALAAWHHGEFCYFK